MSFGPPGAMGTIQRTGLAGYDCAHAVPEVARSAAAAAARCRNLRRASCIAIPLQTSACQAPAHDKGAKGHQQRASTRVGCSQRKSMLASALGPVIPKLGNVRNYALRTPQGTVIARRR